MRNGKWKMENGKWKMFAAIAVFMRGRFYGEVA